MFQSPYPPAVRAFRFDRNLSQSSNESAGLDDQEKSDPARRVATGRSVVVVDEVVEPSSGESDDATATPSSNLNRLADDDSDSDDADVSHATHPFVGVQTVVGVMPTVSGSASVTSLSTFTTTTTQAAQTSGSAAPKSSQSPLPASSSPSQTASSPSPAVSTSSTPSSSSPIPSGTGTVEAENDGNGTAVSGAESKGHSGLSGGAVAAIVIVLLLLLAAVGFFLLRKRFKGRGRRLPRAFWIAGVPATSDDFSAVEKGTTSYSSENGAIDPFPLSAPQPVNAPPPLTASAALRAMQRIPPPSANPFSDAHSIASADAPGEEQQRPVLAATPFPAIAHMKKTPSPVATSLALPSTPRSLILPRSPARTTPLKTHFDAPPVPAGAPALVRVIFIPTMPDELAIEVDETLRVVSAYDDGWALCANARGAQGMVPLECLEGGGGHFGMGPNTEGMADPARMSRRTSSLYAAKRTSATSASSRVGPGIF